MIAMKKKHSLPSIAPHEAPPLPPAPAPLPQDPTILVRAREPHWHDGIFHDRKSEYSVPLSQARILGHLVERV
jgi:hypothetical protein